MEEYTNINDFIVSLMGIRDSFINETQSEMDYWKANKTDNRLMNSGNKIMDFAKYINELYTNGELEETIRNNWPTNEDMFRE